jgi:hypothetical protein
MKSTDEQTQRFYDMKKRLQIYISPEADALLREKARADNRSISATVELLIIKDTKSKPEPSRYSQTGAFEMYRRRLAGYTDY